MKLQGALRALAFGLLVAGLAGCGDKGQQAAGSSTHVLGGAGSAPRPAASAPRVDSQGRAIPRPPAPRGANADVVMAGPDAAVAVWEQDRRVVTSSFTAAGGWTPSVPLEEIYGEAGRPQLAGNGVVRRSRCGSTPSAASRACASAASTPPRAGACPT
ncbi:hypothetical protein HK414_15145 [Ramlibacter terrae]|uniref:Uncharacterized protein n=1 Tax=Ramlibacter terrae TaxID=2732511 RepID=A0ABX6P359_9BURK|nr:hypothetical protein HK414_15145 [Ramlibacter terrae]